VPVAAPPVDEALPTPVPVAAPPAPAPPVTTINPAGHEQTGHVAGATDGAVGVEGYC